MNKTILQARTTSAFFVRLCVALVTIFLVNLNGSAQSGSSCGSAVNISLSTSSSTCLNDNISQSASYFWYKFTAIRTVTNFSIAYDLSQNGLIGAVHVYTGSCNTPTEIGATIDTHQDSVKLFLNILSIGQTYYLRLDKYNNSCIGCPTTSSVSFTICSSPAEQLPFQVTGQDVQFDGKIGIGKAPTVPLDVLGNAQITGQLSTTGDGIFSGNLYTGAISVSNLSADGTGSFVFADAGGNLKVIPNTGTTILRCAPQSPWMIGGNKLGSITNAVIGTCDNYDFVVQANGTEYMWLKTNGQLGIGTANPAGTVEIKTTAASNSDPRPFLITSTNQYLNVDNKLFEVTYNGQVYTRELFVQITSFPDYVFKKGYKLMPLKNLDNYIKQYGHLPNVPSAQQVETDGQNVGKLQLIQMEKIEELTLYLLELKRENDLLKTEINELKKAIKK